MFYLAYFVYLVISAYVTVISYIQLMFLSCYFTDYIVKVTRLARRMYDPFLFRLFSFFPSASGPQGGISEACLGSLSY